MVYEFIEAIGGKPHLLQNTLPLLKLTSSYVASYAKIKAYIGNPLPVSS